MTLELNLKKWSIGCYGNADYFGPLTDLKWTINQFKKPALAFSLLR